MAHSYHAFEEAALRKCVLLSFVSPADLDLSVRSDGKAPASVTVAYAASVEFANLGFIVKPDQLVSLPVNEISRMLKSARKIIGADRDLTPIYPGFPTQVQNLSTLTLLVEQILHYMSAGTLLPNYPTVARPGLPIEDMLREVRELTVVPVKEAAKSFVEDLTTASVAISESDRILLQESARVMFPLNSATIAQSLTTTHSSLEPLSEITKNAKNGENLQALVLTLNSIIETDVASASQASELRATIFRKVSENLNNLDYFLRVILALYGVPSAEKWQDNFKKAVVNLSDDSARAVRFRNIPREVRRIIVAKLGTLSEGFHADRLVARRNLWRGVIRTIHAFENIESLSVQQLRALNIIASNIEYQTLNSKIETAFESHDAATAARLLAEHRPGELLRRLVAMLRMVELDFEVEDIASFVKTAGAKSSLSTLISAFNGVLSANEDRERVIRVAGVQNKLQDRAKVEKIEPEFQAIILAALEAAICSVLKSKPAPESPVGISSTEPVSLVDRDASASERSLKRGSELSPAGSGDTLRLFCHWKNNMKEPGYMDIGAVVLNSGFKTISVCTWDSWQDARDWSTYSGDKHVYPGDSAAEFIDVDLKKLREVYSEAAWVAMSIQSWSGFPMAKVDMIAGNMLRSDAEAGDVFDARSVSTAFKPSTDGTQSIPLAVNLDTGKMIWIDSSSGDNRSGQSASKDDTVGSVVYDEVARPRMSYGLLAELWAKAHDTETVEKKVDTEKLLKLL